MRILKLKVNGRFGPSPAGSLEVSSGFEGCSLGGGGGSALTAYCFGGFRWFGSAGIVLKGFSGQNLQRATPVLG